MAKMKSDAPIIMQLVAWADGKIVGYRNCKRDWEERIFLENYEGMQVDIERRRGDKINLNIRKEKPPFTGVVKSARDKIAEQKIICIVEGRVVRNVMVRYNSDILTFKKKCIAAFGDVCTFQLVDEYQKEGYTARQISALPMYMYWWEGLKANKALKLINKHLKRDSFHASKEEILFIYQIEN